ncbi:MAG: hypothetical protein KA167_01230, partial [Ottowia sp.]|nr:hypothetical protein [Ottowia sp.]
MSDTPESIAARADPSSAGGDFDAQSAAPATRERRRWWRVLLWSLAGLLALLLTTLGGVWIWAGSEGSLATALRWAGAERPLVTDEVTGTVRGGGKVRRLVWDEGGLRVEVHDAEILWTPAALLSRTLQIDQLSASRILIDDQRPKAEAAAGPPESLALPLNIRVKALRAGELRWAGPPPYTLQDVAGRFAYDGRQHQLELDSARIEGGSYQARAVITAHHPIGVDVALAGALTAPVPGAEAPVPLTLQARLQGPLTEMQAQADLVAAAPAAGASAPAIPPLPPPVNAAPQPPASATAAAAAPVARAATADVPEAHVTARITPWA